MELPTTITVTHEGRSRTITLTAEDPIHLLDGVRTAIGCPPPESEEDKREWERFTPGLPALAGAGPVNLTDALEALVESLFPEPPGQHTYVRFAEGGGER